MGILTCLKGQDEQRDSLLDSLQSQILMLHSEWHSASSSGKYQGHQSSIQDALQLKLSLVGRMFDTVQKNSQWTSDLVVLLTRLIGSGSSSMVDLQVNPKLYNIVYDMISLLLLNTLGGDSARGESSSKREYTNIVRKMKKEIGDKSQNVSLQRLRQLLPIPRND